MDEYEKWVEMEMKCGPFECTMRRVLDKYRAFKAKAVEPLAVLADRKGWEIAQIKHFSPFPNTWEICLRPKGGQRGEWIGEDWLDMYSYPAAEAKARAYLNGLPDVKEGK